MDCVTYFKHMEQNSTWRPKKDKDYDIGQRTYSFDSSYAEALAKRTLKVIKKKPSKEVK